MPSSSKAVRAIVAALVVTLALPAVAASTRSRAVRKPPAGAPIVSPPPSTQTFYVRGVITDAVTGAPVQRAEVSVLGKSGTWSTDAGGHFEFQVLSGTNVTLVISRPGYQTLRTEVGAITADFSRQIALQPNPPVQVRMTNGTTKLIDLERVEFGYVVPFAGYNKSRKVNMCKTDGSPFYPDRDELKRITGPGASTTVAPCCPNNKVTTFSVELKNGETQTAALTDSCWGYSVEVIATDHISGEGVFLKFSDIAEIIFP